MAVELSRAEEKDPYCQCRLYPIINVYCTVATPGKMMRERERERDCEEHEISVHR